MKIFWSIAEWWCLTAVGFWTGFAAHIFGLQPLRGLRWVWAHNIMLTPKTAPYPANLLEWALQVPIRQHSAVWQPKDFFLWCLHSLELKEFPRRFETNSSLGFSDPVCNLKYAYFKSGPVKHLIHSFVDETVRTWDHQLQPAQHHHVLTLTLLRAINGGVIASSNSRHYVRLKRKSVYKYRKTCATANFHKNYTKWNEYYTDFFYFFRKSQEKNNNWVRS